jgi:hypothetical protein
MKRVVNAAKLYRLERMTMDCHHASLWGRIDTQIVVRKALSTTQRYIEGDVEAQKRVVDLV